MSIRDALCLGQQVESTASECAVTDDEALWPPEAKHKPRNCPETELLFKVLSKQSKQQEKSPPSSKAHAPLPDASAPRRTWKAPHATATTATTATTAVRAGPLPVGALQPSQRPSAEPVRPEPFKNLVVRQQHTGELAQKRARGITPCALKPMIES